MKNIVGNNFSYILKSHFTCSFRLLDNQIKFKDTRYTGTVSIYFERTIFSQPTKTNIIYTIKFAYLREGMLSFPSTRNAANIITGNAPVSRNRQKTKGSALLPLANFVTITP